MISQSRNDIVLEARQKGNKQQEDFFPEQQPKGYSETSG